MSVGLSILLAILGLVIIYLSLAIKYVNPPFRWVIEKNFPGKGTTKEIWDPGLRFLWFPIKPLMFVRNKLFCADKKILVTMGIDDGNPGDPSLVEFKDASAIVKIQLILKVFDPIMATYAVDNYEQASIDRAEATYRRTFAGMLLDEAMVNISERSRIAQEAFKDINRAIKKWGVVLTNPQKEVTILDFVLSDDLVKQRQLILNAEKEYQKSLKDAKAAKKVAILTAEGKAKATLLLREAEGKGEGDKIKLLMDQVGLSREEAVAYLLQLGMIDAVKGSTLIATSEGGDLNFPIKMAATMAAVQKPSPASPQDGTGSTSGSGNKKGGKP